MRLLDHITQCRSPFIVVSNNGGEPTRLSGALDVAPDLLRCPTRYILSDELTRLCTHLAYSKGAQVLACADLIRIPADQVWVEWCEMPWWNTLRECGFRLEEDGVSQMGRRGVFVRSARNGLQGTIRSFWNSGKTALDVYASAMEAHFSLDASMDKAPANDATYIPGLRVVDLAADPDYVLSKCFRFDFEQSWKSYYRKTTKCDAQYRALQVHAAGSIAIAVPILLAFLLLLSARGGLPRRTSDFGRLNRARTSAGRPPLLDHIEVRSPLFAEYRRTALNDPARDARRAPRLHHVRGHLVRRDNQLFWRVPHLRGKARSGIVLSRTVTWTYDKPVPITVDLLRTA